MNNIAFKLNEALLWLMRPQVDRFIYQKSLQTRDKDLIKKQLDWIDNDLDKKFELLKGKGGGLPALRVASARVLLKFLYVKSIENGVDWVNPEVTEDEKAILILNWNEGYLMLMLGFQPPYFLPKLDGLDRRDRYSPDITKDIDKIYDYYKYFAENRFKKDRIPALEVFK